MSRFNEPGALLNLQVADADARQVAMGRIAFFRQLAVQAAAEYELLLADAELHCAEANSEVIAQGEQSTRFYFVSRGVVDVITDGRRVASIAPGDSFGDVALFSRSRRSASIVASAHNRSPVEMISLDLLPFVDIVAEQPLSQASKRLFYRLHVQRAQWRLEKIRIQFPQHRFFAGLPSLAMVPRSNDMDELQALYARALQLSNLLVQWNSQSVDPARPGAAGG